jgi:hypothetical protein
MSEEWRPIPGHPRYEASNHGRVRNVETGRVLKPQADGRGYLKVHLGRAVQVKVHRVIAMAWVALPHGVTIAGLAAWDADHLDFCRTNNHPSNLRWASIPDNRARWEKGRARRDGAGDETAPLSAEEQAAYDAAWEAGGWE